MGNFKIKLKEIVMANYIGGFSFGNDVEFFQNEHGQLWINIDGTQLKGVREIEIHNAVGEVPSITIEFIPKTINIKMQKEIENV